jgi:hypothetical protein
VNDDQWLRDNLSASVPDPPAAPGRADAARRRARTARRRTAAVIATACAVAVVAVAAPMALGGSGSPEPATSVPTTDVPTPGPAAVACPAPPESGTKPTGPGTLPEGAVSVRLCQGMGPTFQPPADALVTGADELVGLVNEQPRTPPPSGCNLDLGPGYLLAFAYPDGSVRTATGELYGCHQLTVGSVTRANPELPWERFAELLRAQRRTESPPDDLTVSPNCGDTDIADGPGLSPVGRPDEMTAAVLCVRYQTATEQPTREVTIPTDDLAVLLADRTARAHPVPPPGDCPPNTPDWTIVGVSAWGDLTTTWTWCGAWSDEAGHYWRPGADAQRILDRLVAEAGRPVPEVDAQSSASEVVAAYVDLLNAGDRDGAVALWHPVTGPPELPTTSSHIDYKEEGVKKFPQISAWWDATQVTALYREQIRDAYVPYRQVVFTVGRDEQGIFRIVGMQLGDVVETGR